MGSYIFVVQSGPIDGRVEEYNEWYEHVHLREVLAQPGFLAARRFEIHGEPFQGARPRHRFLCIYEMETDDPDAVMASLAEAAKGMNVSSALDRDAAIGVVYKAIGPRHSK